jgi:hypothetical protein
MQKSKENLQSRCRVAVAPGALLTRARDWWGMARCICGICGAALGDGHRSCSFAASSEVIRAVEMLSRSPDRMCCQGAASNNYRVGLTVRNSFSQTGGSSITRGPHRAPSPPAVAAYTPILGPRGTAALLPALRNSLVMYIDCGRGIHHLRSLHFAPRRRCQLSAASTPPQASPANCPAEPPNRPSRQRHSLELFAIDHHLETLSSITSPAAESRSESGRRDPCELRFRFNIILYKC